MDGVNTSERRRAIINLSAHGFGVVRLISNVAVSVPNLGVLSNEEYSTSITLQHNCGACPVRDMGNRLTRRHKKKLCRS